MVSDTAFQDMGSLGRLGFALQSFADPTLPQRYQEQLANRRIQEQEMEMRQQELAARQADRARRIAETQRQRAQQERMRSALGSLAPMLAGPTNIPQEQLAGLLQAGAGLGDITALGNILTPEPEQLREVYSPELGGMTLVPQSQALGRLTSAPQMPDLPEDIVRKNYLLNLQEKDPERFQRFQAIGGGVRLDPKDEAKIEKDLRGEFTNLNKDFVKIRDAYQKIQAATPTAAGDISLLISYMKLLDPGSVVREGEFATAQNAAGIPQRVRNVYNNALEGTRLSQAQRDDFLNQSSNLYDTQFSNYKNLEDTYRGLAERANVDVQDVIIDFSPPDTKSSTDNNAVLERARDAIRRGAPREAVLQRLEAAGISGGSL